MKKMIPVFFIFALLNSSGAVVAKDAVPEPAAAQSAELTQAEVGSLMAGVQKCWNPPSVAGGRVTVKFKLDKSGMVVGKPEASEVNAGTKQRGVLAAAAKRAVLKCQPYKLPANEYDSWSEVIINFDTE